MKLTKRILSLLVCMALIIGFIPVVTMPAKAADATETYQKITSIADLTSGDKYLIVYEPGDGNGYVLNSTLTTPDAVNNYKSYTITDKEITPDANMYVTIESVTGGYSIKTTGGKYIGCSTNENKLNSSDKATTYVNTIAFNSDGTVHIVGAKGAVLRYNATSGQMRFRYYKSTSYTSQKAIYLYKLVEADSNVCDHQWSVEHKGNEHIQTCQNANCGAVEKYPISYKYDANNHWLACSYCDYTAKTAAHDYGENDLCVDCGLKKAVYKAFEKVTSAPENWEGTYLIVYEDGKVAFNGARSSLDAVSNGAAVEINDKTIVADMDYAFVVEVDANGKLTIKSTSGYYIGTASDANGLAANTSTAYTNTIEIDADGNAVIKSSGGAYLRYNSASDQLRFRYYSSGTYTKQKAITLYKMQEEAHTHNHEAVVTAPTCTADGYTTYTCACGDSYVANKVDALGHSYNAVVTAPTCTAEGYTTYTCACGDSYVDNKVDALGHAWDEGVIDPEPTCEGAGVKTYTCETCGTTKTEAVSALDHTAAEAVIENNVAPDCDTTGSYDSVVYCSACGAELSRVTTTVDAIGHNYTSVITTQPTYNTPGVETFTCSNCGDTYTESISATVTGLTGSGTVEDPYLINNLDELKWFRDDVNNGNRYNGKVVKLNADIDLEDEEWTPIGDRNVDQGSFLGTFDGANHTISNLWISEWTKSGAGFFSKVGLQSDNVTGAVKNVTFNNVTIVSTQSYVGLIAQAPSGALIENVKITGEVTIQGYGYVGGIVGHGYPTMDNCSVEAEGRIVSNYWGVGAILGFSGDYGSKVTTSTVIGTGDGLLIHGNYGGAAAVTGSPYGAAVDGAYVENVTITSNSDYCMGYVAAGGTVTNATVTNVTATASGAPITPADAVATIGNNVYFSLPEAFEAAVDGDTVELLADVELTETLVIPADKVVTLDLGGYTISQTKECTASYSMIENNGSLTITGNGKISFTDTGAGDPNAYWGTYTIRNAGTLVVENGTIENLSAQNQAGKAFAHTVLPIFQYSGSTTINGGVISGPNYRSIRLWSGDLTINGGTFEGQVWVQCVNDTSVLTINGGTFAPRWNDGSSVFVNNVYDNKSFVASLSITDGTFTTKIGANSPATLIGDKVTGGTFYVAVPEAFCAEGYVPTENGDGTYGVEVGSYVAQIGNVKYTSLSEALNACQKNDTVTLLSDVELTDALTIAADKVITLDLNSFDISYSSDVAGEAMITNKGTLTLTGNGAVNFTYTGAVNMSKAANAISNLGNLTIDGVSVTNTTAANGQIGYAVDNYSGAVLTVESGSVTVSGSYYYDAIRMFCNSETADNTVVINGGTVGTIWMQNPSDGATRNTKDTVKGNLAINGGTVGTVYLEPCAAFEVSITGGTIAGVQANDTANSTSTSVPTGFISGGTFYVAVPEAFCAEGYVPTENGDGTYGVEVGSYVAQIGDVKYTSLQEAVNVGGEITLLSNVELTDMLTIAADKVITLDLNGYTVSMEDASATACYMIKNYGTLTIKDGSAEQTGKLTFNSTTPSSDNSYSVSTIGNGGNLIVESGLIENTTNGSAAYAIDTLWYNSDVSVTVNGGTVKGAKIAIRQVLFSATAQNTLNITDGTVTGSYAAVQTHNYSGVAALSDVNISGGTLSGSYAYYTYYSDAGAHAGTDIEISGGTFNGYLFIYNGKAGSDVAEFADVAITGGTFNGGVYVYTKDADGNAVNTSAISGGTFAEDATDYCVDGYHTVANDEGKYVPSTHEYEAVVTAPTCTAGGYTTYTCACGHSYVAGEVAAKGHTAGAAVKENWVSPSANADGSYNKVVYCTTCGEKLSSEVVVVKMPDATVTVMDSMILTPEDDYMCWPNGATDIDRLLQIVMNFKANETLEQAQTGEFGKYICDFYLTFNGLSGDSITSDNCYLAGNYGEFGWIVIPVDGLVLEDGVTYPIVAAYDANLTYEDICGSVKNFTAAIYIDPAILEANPNMTVTLELRMTNPENADDVMVIGEPAVYTVSDLKAGNAEAQIGNNYYATLQEAIGAAGEGDTIKLLANAELNALVLMPGISLDLNGYTLETSYVVGFKGSDVIDSSAANTGLLKVAMDKVMLSLNNSQLPVYNAALGGYQFLEINIKTDLIEDTVNDVATFKFYIVKNADYMMLLDLMRDGAADNNLTVMVKLSWITEGDGENAGNKATQYYAYSENMNIHVAETHSTSQYSTYTCELKGINSRESISYAAVLQSGTDVELTFAGN